MIWLEYSWLYWIWYRLDTNFTVHSELYLIGSQWTRASKDLVGDIWQAMGTVFGNLWVWDPWFRYTRVIPILYCLVFGPGKGKVRWTDNWSKEESTVMITWYTLTESQWDEIKHGKRGKGLLRAIRILLFPILGCCWFYLLDVRIWTEYSCVYVILVYLRDGTSLGESSLREFCFPYRDLPFGLLSLKMSWVELVERFCIAPQ